MQIIKNEKIMENNFLLLDENGISLGIVSKQHALDLAKEKGYDVILISKTSDKVVCKITSYDKYRYEMQKKEKNAKKKSAVVDTKEIHLSSGIETHDLETKAENAKKMLLKGDKVKVIMRLRGREVTMADFYIKTMEQFYDLIADYCRIEKPIHLDGKIVSMTVKRR